MYVLCKLCNWDWGGGSTVFEMPVYNISKVFKGTLGFVLELMSAETTQH